MCGDDEGGLGFVDQGCCKFAGLVDSELLLIRIRRREKGNFWKAGGD